MDRRTEHATPEIARVTVNLPWAVWQYVTEMAEEQSISKTETLRRCISTEVFRRRIEKEGASLSVTRPDGTHELVQFPY